MSQSELSDLKLSGYFTLYGGGREVMRITPEGELIVHDATEAAKALKHAWDNISIPKAR